MPRSDKNSKGQETKSQKKCKDIVKPIKTEKEVAVETKCSDANLRTGHPLLRIITGSYEHNVMCLALALNKTSEVFSPIFHFTAHSQSVRCLAISKRYLASGSNDEHIRVYDIQRRKELGNLIHHSGSITVLQFYRNWLFSAADDGRICIWKTKDWEPFAEMKGHNGPINDLSIHPSGKIAITVGKDKTLRLWNLMTAKKASILRLSAEAYQATWLPNGEHYVVGFDRKLEVYHKGKLQQTIKLPSSLQRMSLIDVAGDKTYLAVSLSNGKLLFFDMQRVIESSDSENKKSEADTSDITPSFELTGHGTRVKSFSSLDVAGTTLLVSISSDGKIVVWDMLARDQIAVYMSADRLNCCVVMPDDVENLLKRKRLPEEEEQKQEQEQEVDSGDEADQKTVKDSSVHNKRIKQEVDIVLES